MGNSQELELVIKAKNEADSAFNSCLSSVDRFSKSVVGKIAIISTAMNQFRGAIDVVRGVLETLASPLIRTAEAGEQLKKTSEMLGVSVEKLSGLKYASEQSEASLEALTVGMGFFSKSLFGVNEEGKDTSQILKQLGVDS